MTSDQEWSSDADDSVIQMAKSELHRPSKARTGSCEYNHYIYGFGFPCCVVETVHPYLRDTMVWTRRRLHSHGICKLSRSIDKF